MNQEQFLAERRTMIGASDVGTILGLNRWQSPHQVFLSKLGLSEVEDNEAMESGRDLEQWIIENRFIRAAEKRLGHKVHVVKPPLIRHADHPHLACHCDGLAFKAVRKSLYFDFSHLELDPLRNSGQPFISGVEIKNVSQIMYDKEWGEEWTDVIPEQYILQCQYSMYILRSQAKALGIDEPIEDWLVGAFVGGRSFRMHRVVYNEELIQSVLPHLHHFWELVQTKTPPDPDATPFCTTAYNLRAAERDNEERTDPTPELDALAEHYLITKQIVKEKETELDLLKNQIIEKLGGAAVCAGPDWTITWRKSSPRKKTDWPAVAEDAMVPLSLIEKHTTTTEAERSFRCNRKKEMKNG